MQNDELNSKIQLLERRLNRERLARKAAEAQLEEFSQRIYYSNKALKESVSVAQKKQAELEYLSRSSRYISNDDGVTPLVTSTIDLTMNFCDASIGACFFCKAGKISTTPAPIIMFKDGSNAALADYKSWSFPSHHTELLDSWSIQSVADERAGVAGWLLSSNFQAEPGEIGWLVFFLESEFIDEEKLYVLDTTIEHLRLGVARQIETRYRESSESVLEKMRQDLAATQKQLVIADRMSTLGQLAAGVAHEINNPVGFIQANHQFLTETVTKLLSIVERINETTEDAQLSDFLNQMDISFLKSDLQEVLEDNAYGLKRIADIVKNLKSFTHSTSQERGYFDSNACIEQAVKIAAATIKVPVQFDIRLSQQSGDVFGDRGEIEQVLLNLIVNASHAIETEGEISITSLQVQQYIQVEITDNGCGIPEKDLEEIFSPFFTSKPVGEGTGLGLAISRSIMDAHEGEISVTSELGVGTCVTLLLPIAPHQAASG